MKIEKVLIGAPWLTPEERVYIRKFLGAVHQLFLSSGVKDSPLLALRVVDVAVHLLLSRRQERALIPEEKCDGTPELSGALADQIGKGRERLRKAIKELEEACARLGSPVDTGIAGQMLPLVRQTSDLLHHTAPPAEDGDDERMDSSISP
jgi:myo-inositol-1-phosphate synthase